ncbi:MAG: hypothetical protein AAF721_38925 [Myxococcota bacterium]
MPFLLPPLAAPAALVALPASSPLSALLASRERRGLLGGHALRVDAVCCVGASTGSAASLSAAIGGRCRRLGARRRLLAALASPRATFVFWRGRGLVARSGPGPIECCPKQLLHRRRSHVAIGDGGHQVRGGTNDAREEGADRLVARDRHRDDDAGLLCRRILCIRKFRCTAGNEFCATYPNPTAEKAGTKAAVEDEDQPAKQSRFGRFAFVPDDEARGAAHPEETFVETKHKCRESQKRVADGPGPTKEKARQRLRSWARATARVRARSDATRTHRSSSSGGSRWRPAPPSSGDSTSASPSQNASAREALDALREAAKHAGLTPAFVAGLDADAMSDIIRVCNFGSHKAKSVHENARTVKLNRSRVATTERGQFRVSRHWQGTRQPPSSRQHR